MDVQVCVHVPVTPKAIELRKQRLKKEGLPQTIRVVQTKYPQQRIETWFQDEMRTGQQGTLTRQWGERGTRLCVPKQTEYEFVYLFGAACSATGKSAALVLPESNTAMMNLFLQEMSKVVGPDTHAVLVLDQAAWHHSKSLQVPENITLVSLPPYSPELNPMERVWAYLRSHYLANRIYENYDAIVEAVSWAWNQFRLNQKRVQTVTHVPWLSRFS